MSTYKSTIKDGAIVALANDSWATSEIIAQDEADTDFESIREVRTQKLLANQLVGAEADKAYLNCPVAEGDRLFIKDSNDVIHDTTALNVTSVTSGDYYSSIIPAMTGDADTDVGTVLINGVKNTDGWQLFDKDNSTYLYNIWNGNKIEVVYEFDEVPINYPLYTEFKFWNKENNVQTYSFYNLTTSGSIDGINWILLNKDIHHYTKNDSLTHDGNVVVKNKICTHKYKFYKFELYCNGPESYNYMKFQGFDLLTQDTHSIDTSVITAGAVPTHVWNPNDELRFNNTLATEKDSYKEYGTHGSFLYTNVLYNDVLLSGRNLQTQVQFHAIGNTFIDITGQIFKAV